MPKHAVISSCSSSGTTMVSSTAALGLQKKGPLERGRLPAPLGCSHPITAQADTQTTEKKRPQRCEGDIMSMWLTAVWDHRSDVHSWPLG